MSIQYDSRHVLPGDVFLAMPGLTVDGRAFMQQAVDHGAGTIYYEQIGSEHFTLPKTHVPLIPIEHLSRHQGNIAAEFYGFPSRELTLIGITGTNGKTSTSYFIAQCLSETAVLGTTGYGRLNQLKKLAHTTPMAADIQRILRELIDSGFASVAMEVSSHALDQHRVVGVDYDMAVFTNLSRDHLDFHGDMAHYAEAKKKLFSWPTLQSAIVNSDDLIGQEIMREHEGRYSLLTYSMHHQADISVLDIQPIQKGFRVDVQTPWGRATFCIPLLGLFNIQNCLAVIGVLGCMGVSLADIVSKIAHLKSAPGRMEVIAKTDVPTVVIDFAHTPDALEQTVSALRDHCKGALYCVFGCGGNRDPGKRPLMGAIASRFCDHVIITNDNPRHENPEAIAASIAQAVDPLKLSAVILDRREAIIRALEMASVNDVILIAGKGHEDYQIVGDDVLPFNDGVVVRELLS